MPGATSPRDLAVGLPASLLVGLVVGTIGTFKHQYGVSAVTGAGFPSGLVLALAMVAALLVALRILFPVRWYAVAAAVGVVAACWVLLLPGASGGSTVVLLNTPGLAWTIGPAVIGAVAAAWPRRRRRGPAAREAGGILDDARTTKDD